MQAEKTFSPRDHRMCDTRYFDEFELGERFVLPSRTMTDRRDGSSSTGRAGDIRGGAAGESERLACPRLIPLIE